MATGATLKRTPLYEEHVRLGARRIPFAGFEMPVYYPAGIVAEHRAVREAVGLFDVSHMGEFEVRGPDALAFLAHVTTNDPSALALGQAQYSLLCNESGGIVDDLLVYRFADRFLVVVNAANIEKDFAWLRRWRKGFGAELVDRSDETALLALQGPKAGQVLARVTDAALDGLGYYRALEAEVAGERGVVSRTGYTGEDGFEIFTPARAAVRVWRALLDAGRSVLGEPGCMPAGLGARDTLRLEVGYALYGNDIDETTTPLEAGLERVVKFAKSDFVGRAVLERQRAEGVRRRLMGFELLEKGVPRPGYDVHWNGAPAGTVRSGTMSPTLGKGIGTVYLPAEVTPGTAVQVWVRGKPLPGVVAKMPFYRRGSRASKS
ncbi:MAG: glycine cleavage system aminomethyltransferase GcvT [Gemmatimonadetes bacterium]|nr:glycine cleavage system aminomethyltransferase GcvT [Gemmatimonadota bacterium]